MKCWLHRARQKAKGKMATDTRQKCKRRASSHQIQSTGAPVHQCPPKPKPKANITPRHRSNWRIAMTNDMFTLQCRVKYLTPPPFLPFQPRPHKTRSRHDKNPMGPSPIAISNPNPNMNPCECDALDKRRSISRLVLPPNRDLMHRHQVRSRGKIEDGQLQLHAAMSASSSSTR